MKIKDITEGLYDTLTGLGQAAKQVKSATLNKKTGTTTAQIQAAIRAGQNVRQVYNALIGRGMTDQQAKDALKYAGGMNKADVNYGKAIAQQKAQQPAQAPSTTTQAQPATPAPDTLDAIPTGKRIVVQIPPKPGQTMAPVYYKTNAGWTNENGQAVTKPESIAYLDNLADQIGKIQSV